MRVRYLYGKLPRGCFSIFFLLEEPCEDACHKYVCVQTEFEQTTTILDLLAVHCVSFAALCAAAALAAMFSGQCSGFSDP